MKIYRLKEFKTNQLRKLYLNGNITEEQFNTADKFFKDHSAYEKEIDWNKGLKITWEDLEKVISKERNTKSQAKKKIRKGLEGFKEGKDYLVLEETDSYIAYQPFTWEASRMIASHYVEPSRNRKGETKDAEWCTAYQKDSGYWDSHNEIEAFIYICGESIPSKKVAISISKENLDASGSKFLYYLDNLKFNIWDFNDYNFTIEINDLLDVVPNLYDLIEEAYNNWKDRIIPAILSEFSLNPDTNRYDYNKDLPSEKLKYLVSNNGDGFTINFGEIKGSFNCSDLGLKSLKGAPQTVGGNFYCYENELTSLKGAPQEVGRYFDCSRNRLTSLEGAPQKVRGDFNCNDNKLTSLKGAPQTIGGCFNCSTNNLTSLEGAPQTVGGSFYCSDNHLTSLKGSPQIVDGKFNCAINQLTSLKGSPQEVGENFYCYENELTSLKGAPQEVGWNFDCSKNNLTSLEGAPQEVGWSFFCNKNHLTSLKGAPQIVGENFFCNYNPDLHSLDGIGEVRGKIHKDF